MATIIHVIRQSLIRKIKKWKAEKAEWIVFTHSLDPREFYIETDAVGGIKDFTVLFEDDRMKTCWETDEARLAAKVGEDPHRYNFFEYSDPDFEDKFMAELRRWAKYRWERDGLEYAGYPQP